MTIQAVSDAAGVTKGGLLHHFPNKQALVEAVFSHLLEQLDADIDALIAVDKDPRGAFTRAYLEVAFADSTAEPTRARAALFITTITDSRLRRLWSEWLEERLHRHRDTDRGPIFDIVRLAAEGIWLANMLEDDSVVSTDLRALRPYLLAMTKQDEM